MSRILVVDDEAFLRRTLSQSLGMLGHDVTTADSGQSALKRVTESPPDLVLTDVNMPENEQGKFILQLRADWPHVPVIVMSGSIGDEFAAYTRAGCFSVEKPFAMSQLVQVVNLALKSRKPAAP